ncbi:MAG: hypothetical protein Q4F67_17590 [Propionibacteriaceae bacterium]|nr:hypothetical protein [Propionibacteriaceae bacterium]
MRVNVTRSGDWWAVEASFAGQAVYTQVKRLDQVEEIIRSAFATLDIDISGETLDVAHTVPGAELAQVARTKSREAAAAMASASESMRHAADALQRQGLSVRDIGVLLGVSPQRVSQLTSR